MSWDEIDKWAEEQRKKHPPHIAPEETECAETGKTISRDAMRTRQADLRISRGFHPFGFRLREPRGETCGTCIHLLEKETPGRRKFFKCAKRGDTNGPGTDCRKKWPACERWDSGEVIP
jgi:hypothetical protein